MPTPEDIAANMEPLPSDDDQWSTEPALTPETWTVGEMISRLHRFDTDDVLEIGSDGITIYTKDGQEYLR